MRKVWHNGFCRDIAPLVKHAHESCGLENHQTKATEEVLLLKVTNQRNGKGRTILLDLEDEEFVKSYFWFLHPRGVMTSVGKTAYFLLARALVKAEHNECVLFRNGDSTDCRKANLVRVTRSELNKNARHEPNPRKGIYIENYRDQHGKARERVVANININGHRRKKTFEINRYGEMEAKLMAAGWRLNQMPDDLRQRIEEDLREDGEQMSCGLDENGTPIPICHFDFSAIENQ
jgi:hypothetical protein